MNCLHFSTFAPFSNPFLAQSLNSQFLRGGDSISFSDSNAGSPVDPVVGV